MGSDIVKHHDYIYCMVVSFPVSSSYLWCNSHHMHEFFHVGYIRLLATVSVPGSMHGS